MLRMCLTRVAGVAVLLVIASCVDDATDEIAGTQQEIHGGTATAARPSVGNFSNKCTATLIGPRHVLTASHCVNGCMVTGCTGFSFPPNSGDWISFSSTSTVIDCNASWNATRCFAIAGFQPFTTYMWGHVAHASGDFFSDVALITLATSVPSTIAVPSRVAGIIPSDGARASLFGISCDDVTGSGFGTKRVWSYDYFLNQHTINRTCGGDSGGPSFHGNAGDTGGIWGVTAGDAGDGSDVNGFVPAFRAQIESLWRDASGNEVGFDRGGADLTSATAASVTACRDMCAGNNDCRSFTYRASDTTCFLKKAASDPLPNGPTTSGLLPLFETGWNRSGFEYSNTVLADARPEACAAKCNADPACQYFSYRFSDSNCSLKNGASTRVASAGYASGSATRRFEVGYDRVGRNVQTLTVASVHGCERECAKNELCGAYTFRASDGRCWLTDGSPNVQAATGFTSGMRRGVEPNSDRFGTDYTSFTTSTMQPEVCQAACARDSVCKSWTYRPYGNIAYCFLKSSVHARVNQPGMTSGVNFLEFAPL